MTNKIEVIKDAKLKCTRCDQTFTADEIKAEVLTIGMLITVCPKCGMTLTVSTFPTEYLTIEEPRV